MTSQRPSTIAHMDCTEFVLLVDELVATDPDHWGPVIDKHLADCPPCLIYLQQMLDIQTILAQARDGQRLTDDEVDRVLVAIATL